MRRVPRYLLSAALCAAACHRAPLPAAVPTVAPTAPDERCEGVALERTEAVKAGCSRLLRYLEPKMPPRAPIPAVSRCATTASGNRVRYALLGQSDPRRTRRLYFVSAGLQGLFVNKKNGGRPSALTGQPGGHARIDCDGKIELATDSLLSILLHDRELYDPRDTAVIAVFATGGRIKIKNIADNFTMVAFWKSLVMQRARAGTTRDFVYAGMSLGGALALALAAELDDVYPAARHTLVAQAPVGRRGGWIYPVDEGEKYRNPGGENSRGLTRVMQKGWYAHRISDRSLWQGNVRAAAWLSGAPKLGYHEAWNTALGPIAWNAYAHDEMGGIFHPEVQLDQASFIRERLGLRRCPDPVLLPESKEESERCLAQTYAPAWDRAYAACLAGDPPAEDGEEERTPD